MRMTLLSAFAFASLPLIVQCLGWMPCPQSIPTVSYVSRCPSSEDEWIEAAVKKSCSALEMHQNCSDSKSFVYHCVLNQEATKLMEVCAPIWYMSGYCARFSIADQKLINDPGLECSKFEPPCPPRFPSNESYKYQMCYNNVIESLPTTHIEKPRDSANIVVVIALLVIFGTITVCLLTLLIVRFESKWRKQSLPTEEIEVLPLDEDDHEKEYEKKNQTSTSIGDDIKQRVVMLDAGVQTDTSGEIDERPEFISLSRKIKEKCPIEDIKTIRDLREKISRSLRVPIASLWVVDQETGTVYKDDTKIELSKIQRYALMLGNSDRTSSFDDGIVETDVINNKVITKGKVQMSCNHFTVPETLFDWIRETLPGHTDEKLHCPKCRESWDIEEVFQKCNLSEDEEIFFKRVWKICEDTRQLFGGRQTRPKQPNLLGLEHVTRSLGHIPDRRSTFQW